MKKILILFLFFMTFFSCTKERCVPCEVVTESNYRSADDKCNGYHNNYPTSDIISNVPIGIVCTDELKAIKSAYESSVTKTLCAGVTYTVKTKVNCK